MSQSSPVTPVVTRSTPEVAVVQRRPDTERLRTLRAQFSEAAAQAADRRGPDRAGARVLTDAVRADIFLMGRSAAQGPVALDGIPHTVAGLPDLTTQSFSEFAMAACHDQ